MADRAHKTRQKLTFRVPVATPRNPLVVPAARRVAGPHRKSRSAERSAARVALQRTPVRDDESDA